MQYSTLNHVRSSTLNINMFRILNMENLLSDRIQEILDAGFSQADLCRAAGITKGTANQWLSGGIKSMKIEYAMGIQALTGYNALWIVTGKGSKKSLESFSVQESPKIIKIKRVELKLSAGITGFQIEADHDQAGTYNLEKSWIDANGLNPESLIAIKVRGDSMIPNLHHGDTVVINTADTKPKDGIVFAFNYEGEAVIKRLSRDAGDWWLTSDNSDKTKYDRKLCRGSDCIIIGRVVRKESDVI